MSRALLHRFVHGARQVLVLQLILAVTMVALAGWTLGVTTDLLRERERLRTRVAQLEETLVANDVVVPSISMVVESTSQRARSAYPPPAPADTRIAPAAAAEDSALRIISDLFTPAPTMRVVIVHVRNEAEARIAAPIAETLAQRSGAQVIVALAAQRQQRPAGYAYFDGRQSGAAAALVQAFADAARAREVAPWSGQVRGVALPAQGEYTPDRLDIMPPPLSPTQMQRLDPAPPAPPEPAAAAPAPLNR